MKPSRSQSLRPTTRPAAFTLLELMVVLGIIAIVGTLGVAGLSAVTGQNSREAGQNLVAAALGQARTIALNEGKTAGILFSMDPPTGRVAMTLVIVGDTGNGLEDPDPYDKYKGWSANPATGTVAEYKAAGYDASGAPIPADRVIGIASDATSTFKPEVYPSGNLTYSRLADWVGNFRPVVKTYRAAVNSNAALASIPAPSGPYPGNGVSQNSFFPRYAGVAPTAPQTGPANNATDAFTNPYWSATGLAPVLSAYSGAGERQLLPAGVGCQIIIQPTLRPDLTEPAAPAAATTNKERYLQLGTILFDAQGKLSMQTVAISPNSTLGKQLNLNPVFGDFRTAAAGVGVAIFETQRFLAATDPYRRLPAYAVGASQQTTFADYLYQNSADNTGRRLYLIPPAGSPAAPAAYFALPYTKYYSDNGINNPKTAPINAPDDLLPYNERGFPMHTTFAYERLEETWLDSYAVRLLVNAYSGTLSPIQ